MLENFDISEEDLIMYGGIIGVVILSFLIYQYFWHIVYGILCLIDHLLFGLNYKYGLLVVICCIALVVLAVMLYKNHKKIVHVNLAPALSE